MQSIFYYILYYLYVEFLFEQNFTLMRHNLVLHSIDQYRMCYCLEGFNFAIWLGFQMRLALC